MATERTITSQVPEASNLVYNADTGATQAIFDGGKLGRLQARLVVAASRFAGLNIQTKKLNFGDRYGLWEPQGARDLDGQKVYTYNFGMNDGELGSTRIPAQDRLTADPRVWMD